jgi:hypothetical protein
LEILFSSILSTCPNHHNLFNLIVSVIAGFLTLASMRQGSSNIKIILQKWYRGMYWFGLAQDSCTKRFLENNNLSIPMDIKNSILLKQ